MELLKKVNENPFNFNEKMVSMLKVMCHVRYLNSLAKLIINHYESIRGCILENKNLAVNIINYIITLNEEQGHNLPEEIKTIMIKYDTSVFQRLILIRLLAEEYFYLAVPQFID